MRWEFEHAPPWFRNAVETPTASEYAPAAQGSVHYLSWNGDDRTKPALLFMHGFRAHARWWSFIAPYFRDRYRVYALDFAGMGDSPGRETYDPLSLALDIKAVIDHAAIGPATLVGHSFGGGRTLRLCAEHPELVRQAVILDSYVHFADVDERRPFIDAGPRKVYPTYEAAKARYRLIPAENAAPDYVVDYIAHHSIEPFEGGYRWKFADNLTPGINELDGEAVLRKIRVPLTYMYGEYSRVAVAGRAQKIVDHIDGARGPIAIPEAHHHLMLDQPLATIAALRAALY